MVAAPVFSYGMYSAPEHLQDTIDLYAVTINGKTLNCAELNFMDRDLVQISPADYEKQAAVNESVYQTIHRYLGFMGLMDHEKYLNHISDNDFNTWYRSKLERMTGQKIQSLDLKKQHFIWKNDGLVPQ
jgi:hypothetical protein